MKSVSPDTFFDESPRPGSFIEWWFFHGSYSGPGVAERFFMLTLFRHSHQDEKELSNSGFSFLLSILDPKSGKQQAASRIDGKLLEFVRSIRHKFQRSFSKSSLVNAFLDETLSSGPPQGIELVEDRVTIKADPLLVEFGDFLIKQENHELIINFVEPHSGRRCCFILNCTRPRLRFDVKADEDSDISLDMMYYSYPRLVLEGTVAGLPVSGRAWFDHQWGDHSWLISGQENNRVIGWNCFGINLNDGSDLFFITHFDARNDQTFARHLTFRNKEGDIQTVDRFSLTPVRYWQSGKTAIRYPVEWRIEVAELNLDLSFVPMADNQEIAVFGLMRAIWEGAGRVTGSSNGRTVSGTGRGEFQGYGYIFDFSEYLENVRTRINRHIEEFLPHTVDERDMERFVGPVRWKLEPEAYNRLISAPVWDLISRKGKCWRPIYALLMLDSLGVETGPYEALICVFAELLHTGSLIIDDIEDSSLLRRGDRCIHLKFGQDVAINAANTIYFMPSFLLFEHPHLSASQKLEIHEIMMRQFVRAHIGQTQDIYWTHTIEPGQLENWLNDSLPEKILQTYEYKTGALLQALSEIAVVISGADGELRQACLDFASSLGVAFQIVDDVNNFSEAADWRKACAEDLVEGKLTYVILRALEKSKRADRKLLKEILSAPTAENDNSRITAGINIVRRSGVLESCREEARNMVVPEWERLAAMLQPSDSKILLRVLYLHLLDMLDSPNDRLTGADRR